MGSQDGSGRSPLIAPLVRLARRGSLLIATDFDGTLAPVVRDPRRARPLQLATRALAELAGRTPVAVISGRDLANLAVQCPVPGVLLLGSYGLEPWMRLSSGEALPIPPAPSERLLDLAHHLEELTEWLPGVQVEAKAMGVAVHYRNSPEPRRVGPTVRRMVEQLAAHDHLEIVRGKLVIEVRPPRSGNKGTALAAILDRLQPRGCVFAGDDLGDLPAMEELHRRSGGLELALAIGVLGPEANPRLAETADLCLEGPLAWAELLKQLVDGLREVSPAGRLGATAPAGR
ncbi:MAG: trehalose-phosphatase [Candidatus Dormibacteria bacterium]